MKRIGLSVLLLTAFALAGCLAKATETPSASMPNPAARFCEEQGYTVEIRTADDGSQQGFCLFPDGSECDEWAFFRGECGPKAGTGGAQLPNPASKQCEDAGYTLEIRTTEDGSQQGFCLFPDGTSCDEWAFFRGECGPGTPQP